MCVSPCRDLNSAEFKELVQYDCPPFVQPPLSEMSGHGGRLKARGASLSTPRAAVAEAIDHKRVPWIVPRLESWNYNESKLVKTRTKQLTAMPKTNDGVLGDVVVQRNVAVMKRAEHSEINAHLKMVKGRQGKPESKKTGAPKIKAVRAALLKGRRKS